MVLSEEGRHTLKALDLTGMSYSPDNETIQSLTEGPASSRRAAMPHNPFYGEQPPSAAIALARVRE